MTFGSAVHVSSPQTGKGCWLVWSSSRLSMHSLMLQRAVSISFSRVMTTLTISLPSQNTYDLMMLSCIPADVFSAIMVSMRLW